MAHGTLFLLGGKIRITQGTRMHICTHTCTYTCVYAVVLPVAMYRALKSHSRKFAPPGWTFLPYSARTGSAETASIPQTAAKPLHPSHRALQELQVNFLQSWIRATASACDEAQDPGLALTCSHQLLLEGTCAPHQLASPEGRWLPARGEETQTRADGAGSLSTRPGKRVPARWSQEKALPSCWPT